MALDPRLSLDEKRRLTQRAAGATALQQGIDNATAIGRFPLDVASASVDRVANEGLRGVGVDVVNGAKGLGRAIKGGASSAASAIYYGAGGPGAVPADPPEAARAARPQDLNVPGPAQLNADTIRADPGQFGLTRIFKSKDANGNSVYTNIGAAPAGAETRYYNQYGNREGMDATGTHLVNDPAASDQALLVAAGHGIASKAYAQRGQLARSALDQQDMLDHLPPDVRGELIKEQLSQAAQDNRATADRGLRRDVAAANLKIAQQNADTASGNVAFQHDRYERERLAANPQQGIQETLGAIALLPRDQQIAALSDGSDPRNGRAINALRSLIAQKSGTNDFQLAAATKTGGLRRFLQEVNPFVENNDFTLNDHTLLGTGIKSSDYGLSEDQMATLLDSLRNAQARNHR